MLTMAGVVEGWREQEPETPPAILEGYRRLAASVVLAALKDAATDTPEGHEARCWLLSEGAGLYLEAAGLHVVTVRDWLESGAPFPKRGGKGEK